MGNNVAARHTYGQKILLSPSNGHQRSPPARYSKQEPLASPSSGQAMHTKSAPKPEPRLVAPASDTTGPIYEYRGATIHSNAAGSNFVVSLASVSGAPQVAWGGLSHLDAAVAAIDAWLDAGELPMG
jgi:hypothetical protein